MTAKNRLDRLNSIIDKILPDWDIADMPFLRQLLESVDQALHSKYDEAISEQELEKTLVLIWTMISRREGDYTIQIDDDYHDGQEISRLVVNMADLPFVLDSVRICIGQQNIPIHNFYNIAELAISRDIQGKMQFRGEGLTSEQELISIFILDKISEAEKQNLATNLVVVLDEVRNAVTDWQAMQDLMMEVVETWEGAFSGVQGKKKLEEVKQYMEWLHEYYTFLGAQCYSIKTSATGEAYLKKDSGNGLGIVKNKSCHLMPERDEFTAKNRPRSTHCETGLFYITKAPERCRIHRDVYTDLLVLRILGSQNQAIGEVRFAGLLSSEAYDADPSKIPWLRKKITDVIEQVGLKSRYSNKALAHILKNVPTDEMFQSTIADLKKLGQMQLSVKGLSKTKVVIRSDILELFYTLIILMPKEYYNMQVMTNLSRYIQSLTNSDHINWESSFSDSSLVSIYYSIKRVPGKKIPKQTAELIEKKIVEIGKPWWEAVLTAYRLSYKVMAYDVLVGYKEFFTSKYQSKYSGLEVLEDIAVLEQVRLNPRDKLYIRFNEIKKESAEGKFWSMKMYQKNSEVTLSDILPVLENLGLWVIREDNFRCEDQGDSDTVYSLIDLDVTTICQSSELTESRIQEIIACVESVIENTAHSDVINRLLTQVDITFSSLQIIRAYIYYAKQTNFNLSTEYIKQTVVKYPNLTAGLVEIFLKKFTNQRGGETQCDLSIKKFIADVEEVSSLNEDRVFRRLLSSIQATVRTNYFCEGAEALVLKIKPEEISDMPLPIPKIETFVFSYRVVGTHLRMSLVSRGGIRWSDRLEDYRTEVLGLMHAQQLKNAVIIPDGAKGVFVPKQLSEGMSREAYLAEGLRCYQIFIKAMISISDNYIKGALVAAENMRCYDGEDAYFVVAADKGTATFSDYANAIAAERRFWLSDAFASGGQHGYDHKKLGITAKGAWQSVCWHFKTLGIDPDRDSFTAVGIGDMSGDVFGNGMLLSKNICLVAAFDHRHIFIDPTPNKKEAFKERKRLFGLSSSSWDDYSKDLLSEGGRVYARHEKYLHLTDEIKALFGIDGYSITPNELIQRVLAAEVDLIWNGGIGTYVRASTESNIDVKDMANDGCRIDATQLRARVFGEGGNLGITQLARREYELAGGLINTDFIDNAGGVACSDSEVNIKIALGSMEDLVARNHCLEAVQLGVESMILTNITLQNFAISADQKQSEKNLDVVIRYIGYLNKEQVSNQKVDKLPSKKEILSRQVLGKTVMRSEFAIMCSHAKTLLTRSLLRGDLIDDPYALLYLYHAFPGEIASQHNQALLQHVLKREIIATQVSNACVNDMGVTYIQQMRDDTGCSAEMAVRAYFIALEIFQVKPVLHVIYENKANGDVDRLLATFIRVRGFLRSAALWIIQNIDLNELGSIKEASDIFTVPVELLTKQIAATIDESEQERTAEMYQVLMEVGAGEHYATVVAYADYMAGLLNVVWGLKDITGKIDKFAEVYFWLGKHWQIIWFREQVDQQPLDSIWSQIAKTNMLKEIDGYQRSMAKHVFVMLKSYRRSQYTRGYEEIVDQYHQEYQAWVDAVEQMKTVNQIDFPMLSVVMMRLAALSSVMKVGQIEYE